MKPIIRVYDDGDHDQVVALWQRVFPAPPPRNDPVRNIAWKVKVQRELLLVTEIEGRIAGTVMAGFDGHRGWLYLVAVDPGRRRRGLGSALVIDAVERLRALGCPKVNLQVEPGNEEVVAFYEHLGFQVEPRISMGRQLFDDAAGRA